MKKLLLLVCIWLGTAPGALAKNQLPNIILLIGDDHGAPYFGFMGNDTVVTPNMDMIAKAGLTFTVGHATANHCRPSLRTLMTGLHPQEHGFQASGVDDPSRPLTPLPDSVPTLAEHLQQQGYWTEAIGTNPLLQPISGIARGFERYEILSGPTVTLPPLTVLARMGLVEKVYYQQANAVRRRLAQRLGPIAAAVGSSTSP